MRIENLSLRTKIIISSTLLVLFTSLIAGIIIFINSSRNLEFISKTQQVQIAKSFASMIEISIQKDWDILSAFAKDPVIVTGASRKNFESLYKKLSDLYIKIGKDYEGIAIFDTNSIIRVDAVDKNRIGISIAEREYIKLARQGQRGIGPVVPSKSTGKPIFALTAPILSPNGSYLGCVLGVLKTEYLNRYITSLKLGKTGYAIMINQEGIIIAHPDPEYILKLDTLKDNELKENTKRMISGETGSGEYTFRGKHKIIGFAPIKLTGWSVGVIQEKSEVMALAYSNRNLILIVFGFILLLSIPAVLFLSGSISNPVQKILTTLNQAVGQATDAIFIIGLDKKLQFANPAMVAIIDRPIQEIINKTPDLKNIDIANPGDIWEKLEKGNIWTGRVSGYKKNSTPFTMNLTITPVRDQNDKINSFLAIGRDITQELIMEAHLHQSQKMEAIGTLAGGIAHDFNNILSAIFGYSELALIHSPDKKKCINNIKEIMKAAERARDLVSRIMTFSHQAKQQKKPLRPKYIIKEALKLLRASLPATIDIRSTINSDASIMADPTQIHQIVMNLCTNAGYAMKEKGGILNVELEDVELNKDFTSRHTGLNPGKHISLKISDTGTGIHPEIIDHIFDPFFTTKPQGEGTGLGLSVVHGIINAMAGTIDVSSQMGKGTTFILFIPVTEEEVEKIDARISEKISGGTERILLVDDEEMLIRTGKHMIEGLGYKVTGFTSSSEALKAFLNNPMSFDAVITDHTMPNMTGHELAKKVREIRPDIPVIICSGYLDENILLQIKESGLITFLQKPFTLNDIAKTLRHIIKK